MCKNHKRNRAGIVGIMLVCLASILGIGFLEAVQAITADSGKKNKKAVLQKAIRLLMPFIANQGQIKADCVRYYAKTFGGTFYVTRQGEMVYTFTQVEAKADPGGEILKPRTVKGWTLKETLVGASVTPPRGEDSTQTRVNYFVGKDKSKWITDIPTYESVNVGEVYKGIGLSLKAYGNNVEKLFTVKPNGNPKDIQLKVEGAAALRINEKGELEMKTGHEVVKFSNPIAYQEKDGKRKNVQVAYHVVKETYGFSVTDYDRSLPLIIDPFLTYSTYIGDSGADAGTSIATDSLSNAYVTGWTSSSNFPASPGSFQEIYGGSPYDAFVTKISPDGSSLLYITYIGGNGSEWGNHITVDTTGEAYVTGPTNSIDFPTTPGSFQPTKGPSWDSFIIKLSADGSSLTYATFLGGNGDEFPHVIAADAEGNAYVSGRTLSTNFPTMNPYQGSLNGVGDVFLTKINSDGASLIFSTFLGGSSVGGICHSNEDLEIGAAIVIDSDGHVFLTGATDCDNFPTTPGVAQENYGGGPSDGFIMKIGTDGSSLIYSSFLGGSDSDWIGDVQVDAIGNAYVTGVTGSDTSFPTTPGVVQENYGGGPADGFITKINVDASSLIFSSFLGGTSTDGIGRLAIDANGNFYVAGYTYSTDFPIVNAIQESFGGGQEDAFVSKINPTGSTFVYSTYLGGSGDESAFDIALAGAGQAIVTGWTFSTDFPIINAIQQSYGGGREDAFVVRITDDTVPPFTSNHDPFDGQTEAPIGTNIVVHIGDDTVGVDQSTIVMTVEGAAVTPVITGDPSDYTLTYDPPSDFGYEQVVDVTVDASDLLGNDMAQDVYSFMTEAPAGNPWDPIGDDDGDGIPNGFEDVNGNGSVDAGETDPERKTLFVRPTMVNAALTAFIYWPRFLELFPSARDGFAELPALSEADIEVVVIGDPRHIYAPWADFTHNPATDTVRPQVDIMEIVYYDDRFDSCNDFSDCENNDGHIYFDDGLNPVSSGIPQWLFDIMGYTPGSPVPIHGYTHRYRTPRIYQKVIDNYLNEGVYAQIAANQLPETTVCVNGQCEKDGVNDTSAFNFQDGESGPPFAGVPDATGEFNDITFDASGRITNVGNNDKKRYDEDATMRRVLVHEIGHGLNLVDHCWNPFCIMYSLVPSWELYGHDSQSLYGFGSSGMGPGGQPTECEHSPGNSNDIRLDYDPTVGRNTGVFNSVH